MSSDTRVGVAGTQSATTEVNGLARHDPGIDTHPEKTPDHDTKKTPEPHDDQDVEAAVKHEHVEALQKTTTVDTVHDDVAVRVLNAYGGDRAWTAREEKQLVRKIDRRLLSIVVTTYGLQYYDKAMLAQAVSRPSCPNSGNKTLADPHPPPVKKGSVRPDRRPGPRRGHALLPVLGHLLPRVHLRRVSRHRHGAAVSDREGHVRHRLPLGALPHDHGRVYYLPGVVCPAVLSRDLGERRESCLDVGRGRVCISRWTEDRIDES